MRNVQRQRRTKISVSRIVRLIAASFKMPEIEEGANTSTKASPRPSWLTPKELTISMMKSMLELVKASDPKLRRGDRPTIYIVPQRIREVKKVAYEPKMVSIGPYHHGKERLQGMEKHKLLYLHSFLSRNPKYSLEDYLMAMSVLEDEVRSCYYDNVDQHLQVGNEFVKMMVLDACFIVEIFLRFYSIKRTLELLSQQWEELKQNEEDLGLISAMEKFFFHSNGFEDPILSTIGMVWLIGYDMLLLENQIPFRLLQHIFIMACPVNVPHLLEEMALYFFDGFMPTNEEIEIKDSYYHLLHLFHSHLLPTPTNSKEEPNHSCIPKIKLKPNLSCIPKINFKPNLSCIPKINFKPNLSCIPKIKVLNKLKNLLPCSNKAPLPITKWRQMIPCATDLQLAGVKFKKNEKSNSILNVKFSHGVLEITPFVIDDHSDTLFRNLITFEQCWPEALDDFTTYFVFMDYLVNTSKDVALLHQNGIMDNNLGSDDDVVLLFNRLCIGIFHNFEGGYLEDVHDKVQKHYQKKWNRWWASLKHNYFTNPWSFISLIAASILLLLTITQTFFTVFPRS